jgi:hypothetical protein
VELGKAILTNHIKQGIILHNLAIAFIQRVPKTIAL